jgi:hypothetical protein
VLSTREPGTGRVGLPPRLRPVGGLRDDAVVDGGTHPDDLADEIAGQVGLVTWFWLGGALSGQG